MSASKKTDGSQGSIKTSLSISAIEEISAEVALRILGNDWGGIISSERITEAAPG